MSAMRFVCDTFDTGNMPGTIGASIPAAAAASRKRRKASGEKKNWVIARVAPASSLRFRLSRSVCGQSESGCTSGRSEEHTSELQSLMRNSYAVLCLKNKKNNNRHIAKHE